MAWNQVSVESAPLESAPLESAQSVESAPLRVQNPGPAVAAPAPTLLGADAAPSSRTSAFLPRRAIPDTDLRVYPLALGGSVFGWTASEDSSQRILDRYREFGGNFIDTADSYAAGRSEVVIGNWMRSRRAREEVVIATKIGRHLDHPGLTPLSIIGGVQASLERLQTDYIDLLYFHIDDETVPLEESLGAVDVLLRSGQVRYLAASNFSAERLMEARVLAANGLPRFVALQTHYNLVHRAAYEASLALATRAQGMAVMPYFALAHGFLTGKYRTRAETLGTARGSRAAAYINRKSLRVLGVMERIAREHAVAPASIALAWLQGRGGVAAPVASASRPEQVDALMQAAAIRLSRVDMIDLERVSAP
jgi:aryl-alcohol dehydrogenase-like predicted oxidoreductase